MTATLNSPRFSWRDTPDLIERLTEAQNSQALEHQDVMTWAGMCDSREELERHVVTCEGRVARWVAPVRRRSSKKAA